MRRQFAAGTFDGVDDSVGEPARPEQVGHFGNLLFPERLAAAGMEAFVTDDGELLRLGGDKDQHRVACR